MTATNAVPGGRAPTNQWPNSNSKSNPTKFGDLAAAERNFFLRAAFGARLKNHPPSIHYPGRVFGTTRPPPPARRHFFRTILNCYVRRPMGGIGCLVGSQGPAVPIVELLRKHGSFGPEEVALLGKVFEDVLQTLGLVDRADPLTAMVAKSLVEYAKAGVRDPDRLKALTVQAFTQQQQQQIQRKQR